MAQRNIKARYHVRALGKQPVTFTKAEMVKGEGTETPHMEMKPVTEERDCYLVQFPQGHSIRVTSFEELQRMGYDKKPRMVDMETGDVVDLGGDPYDFAAQENTNVIVMDDEDMPSRRKAKTADATA